jgi:hypothetical protein
MSVAVVDAASSVDVATSCGCASSGIHATVTSPLSTAGALDSGALCERCAQLAMARDTKTAVARAERLTSLSLRASPQNGQRSSCARTCRSQPRQSTNRPNG